MDRDFFNYCANNKLEQAKKLWGKGGINLSFAYAGNTALLQAVQKGNTDTVKWLIEIGAPLEDLSMDNKTALIKAAYMGHTEIVRILLEAGANREACDKVGRTSLAYAELRKFTEIIALLNPSQVPEPAPIPIPEPAPMPVSVPLSEAAPKPVSSAPLPSAVAPDPRIFFELCNNGKLSEAQALYAQGGIDLSFVYAGNTPLTQAAYKGHAKIVRWLIEIGAPIEAINQSKQTALMKAIELGKSEVVEVLLNGGADFQDFLLFALKERCRDLEGQKEIVKTLLRYGENPNSSDSKGETVLDKALRMHIDVVADLVEAGANINKIGTRGTSLLMKVIESNTIHKEKNALALINGGIDIHCIDDDGKTALHYAASSRMTEVARVLIEKGIDIEVVDKREKTALDYVRGSRDGKEIEDMLYVAPLPPGTSSEEIAAHVKASELLQKSAKKGIVDLKTAVEKRNLEMVEYFMEEGEEADQEVETKKGTTPLFAVAVANGDVEIANALMIDEEIDINEHFNDTNYMEIAIKNKHFHMMSFLIEQGFEVYMQDYLEYAQKAYNKDVYAEHFDKLYELFGKEIEEYDIEYVRKKIIQQYTYKNLPAYYFIDLVEKVPDINEQDDKGKTLLHYALEEYRLEGNTDYKVNIGDLWIDALLSAGDIDIQIPDAEDFTPLWYASKKTTPRVVHNMLLMGADVNALCGEDSEPVIMAAFSNKVDIFAEGIVKVLCEFGADVNTADEMGLTPIHAVVSSLNPNLFKLILECGVNPEQEDKNGDTPLHKLAEESSPKKPELSQNMVQIAQLLTEKGANIDAHNKYGQTPLLTAFSRKESDMNLIRFLLSNGAYIDAQDGGGNTPLHYAVAEANINRIRILLDNGADVNVENNNGHSPYKLAVSENKRSVVSILEKAGVSLDMDGDDLDAAFMKACKNGQRGIAEMLIKKGDIDVTNTDDLGRTPLHYASSLGMTTLVSFLINAGVDVNYTERGGQTALHFAAFNRHKDVFKILMENGADPEVADNHGVLPIHIVTSRGQNDLLEVLIKNGSDISVSGISGKTMLIDACHNRNKETVKMLLENNADPNATDKNGNSPLLVSVYNNQKEIVKMLLFAGADVRARDTYGDEGIHIAAMRGFKDMLALLLENGSFINSLNNYGFSPLHVAAHYGNKDIFKWLAEQGADLDLTTDSGKSCVDIAAENGQKELIELISIIKKRRSV